MYDKNQEEKQAKEQVNRKEPVQLTKEEMRQKIRASLAAREQEETTSQSVKTPVYVAAKNQTTTGNTFSNQEKVRQLREAMESQRTDHTMAHAKSSSTNATSAVVTHKPKQRTSSAPSQKNTAKKGATHVSPKSKSKSAYARERNYTKTSSINVSKVFLIVGIVLVLLLAAIYVGGILLYRDKFLPNTYVNAVCVSGMTQEEAEEAIIENAQEMGVTFVTRNGENIVFKGSSFGCETTISADALDEPNAESHALWFIKLFSTSEYTAELNQTYSEDDLVSLIAAYDWGNTPPTDAKIVENEDGTFSIQEEDNGNMVDTEVLSDYTLEQLRSGTTTINMAMSGCYMTASVTAESLEGTLELYTQYASVVITYDMTNREELFDPVGTVELTHETFMDWITFDDAGNLSLDKEAAAEWVETYIVEPYDTFCEDGYTRSFDSTAHGTTQITLTETSTYGWQTDVDATVELMEEYLQAGESITTEPEWIQAGFRPSRSDGTVFGEGTYIEVDICEQHLWFYVDGELYLETDVVTGLASDPERETHTGIFKIRDKIENATLGTYEVQGYETDVSYWMPIDHTGIGLHDLSRSAYGGDIYLTNGSHGCINLPLDMAAAIFEKTVIGMPVIIVE